MPVLARLLTAALLAASPCWAAATPVDSLLAAADRAAGESRHKDAVRLLQSAAAQAPQRVEQISASLAYQLAWAGELKLAEKEFVRATALAPESYELRMTELLVWNWRGRHQDAYDGYSALHQHYRPLPGPLIGMASARNWQGRENLALKNLERALLLDPGNRDALTMRSAILERQRPRAGAFFDHHIDSDGYRVNSTWLQGSWAPAPAVNLTPHWLMRNVYREEFLDETEHWLGVRGTARTWPAVSVWGRIMFLLNRPEGAEYAPWAGDLSAEYSFSDRWHAAMHTERFAADSYIMFPEKITGFNWGASARFVPDPLTSLRVVADRASYSDDNSRVRLQGEAVHELWPPAKIKVGAKAGYLNFARWLDNGLWTPDAWWGLGFMGSFEAGQRDNWAVHGAFETGPSKELGQPAVVYYLSWRLGAYRQLAPRLLGEISFGHTEGNLDTWSGYDRTSLHAGLKVKF